MKQVIRWAWLNWNQILLEYWSLKKRRKNSEQAYYTMLKHCLPRLHRIIGHVRIKQACRIRGDSHSNNFLKIYIWKSKLTWSWPPYVFKGEHVKFEIWIEKEEINSESNALWSFVLVSPPPSNRRIRNFNDFERFSIFFPVKIFCPPFKNDAICLLSITNN